MTLQALYQLYLEDISTRLKASTVGTSKRYFESCILPYFENKQINQITSADVRKWQNGPIESGLEPTTQRNANNLQS